MIKGKTKSGYSFSIDENRLKDMRFIELLSEVDTNPLLLPKMITFVLGSEQKEKLYKHVEKDDCVSVDDVSKEIEEIFKITEEKSNQAKKS